MGEVTQFALGTARMVCRRIAQSTSGASRAVGMRADILSVADVAAQLTNLYTPAEWAAAVQEAADFHVEGHVRALEGQECRGGTPHEASMYELRPVCL